MKKGIILGLVVMGALFSFSSSSTASSIIDPGGDIKCYCTTSGKECAANGATTSHCRTISDKGDCSDGANNCSANPEE